MVCETKTGLSLERCLQNAWRHRNGGLRDSMGALQGPPGFEQVEGAVEIPVGDLRVPTSDVYGTPFQVTGVRHTHVWSVDEP